MLLDTWQIYVEKVTQTLTPQWMYRGRPFTSEKIKDYYGFLYLIENTITGRKYIGRKIFCSEEKAQRWCKSRVTSESDWKKYYGSNDQLKADVKEHGIENFKRKDHIPT